MLTALRRLAKIEYGRPHPDVSEKDNLLLLSPNRGGFFVRSDVFDISGLFFFYA
jgi:hypothetical protein